MAGVRGRQASRGQGADPRRDRQHDALHRAPRARRPASGAVRARGGRRARDRRRRLRLRHLRGPASARCPHRLGQAGGAGGRRAPGLAEAGTLTPGAERRARMRGDGPIRIVIASLVLLVGTVGATAPGEAQAPTGPITIGVLSPLTGIFATYGRDIVDGAQLYVDEVHGQMGNRKIKLVVEDYQVKPDVAVTKIKKLVERDGAHAVVGIVLSAAAIAVKDYVND